MKIFITGVSSGIGYGLVELWLREGIQVYGVGRSNPWGDRIEFIQTDLRNLEQIPAKLEKWRWEKWDLAVLNSGILGEIKELTQWGMWELKEVMEVNLWANKVLIDWLLGRVKEVVAISSGASKNGNSGWGGYSISKAALNMLVKIYANENPSTRFYALAPGVIDTPMVRKVVAGDREKFPSLQRVDAGKVPLQEGVKKVWKAIQLLSDYPSGSYLDVRELPV